MTEPQGKEVAEHRPSQAPFAVEARGVVKRYGRTAALRGVDLRVPWGEVLVLFGANGSGKTTLIKVLAGLAMPTQGEVRIAGQDPFQAGPALRRLVGVVAHQPLLYQDLTAHENLRFFGRMFGLEDREAAIQHVIQLLGLQAQLHRRVRALSHGTQQRLALARALLHDPPILLLDEPETGLDQEAQGILQGLLTDRQAARTVVMTTHNLEHGLAGASLVGLLDRGRIVYQERRERVDPRELRDRYAQMAGASA